MSLDRISALADPVGALDAVNLQTLEAAIATALPEPADDAFVYGRFRRAGDAGGDWARAIAVSGDVMSGNLAIEGPQERLLTLRDTRPGDL
jgi:hypothetical protein